MRPELGLWQWRWRGKDRLEVYLRSQGFGTSWLWTTMDFQEDPIAGPEVRAQRQERQTVATSSAASQAFRRTISRPGPLPGIQHTFPHNLCKWLCIPQRD